jgi:uncharacterized membrane protein YfcA
VALANVLSGALLRTAFALLMLLVAVQMARSALAEGKPPPVAPTLTSDPPTDPIPAEKP